MIIGGLTSLSDMKNNGNGFMDLLERLGMVTKKEEPAQPYVADRAEAAISEETAVKAEAEERDTIMPTPEIPNEPVTGYIPPSPPQAEAPAASYAPLRAERPAVGAETQRRPSGVDLDKGAEIEELYEAYSFPKKGTNTIFLVEEYLKSLPDTLPNELRRQIILRIIGASGLDAGVLLADGRDRIRQLERFSSDFATRTMEITRECESEISKLEQYIANLKNVIADRSNLHKKQVLLIENEIHRLRRLTEVFPG